MEENTKLKGTTKAEYVALVVFCAAIILFIFGIIAWLTSRNFVRDSEIDRTLAEARANGDRYTLMAYADGTENFPMNVEQELNGEYVSRIDFMYGESLAGGHYVRTVFYIGEDEENYGGYGDLWVDSEYEGEQNPLLLPEVANYDPLAEMGLNLSELLQKAAEDVNALPEGTFYCDDFPDSIGAKASYGRNTIIYFYTKEKGKAAAVMFDWSTNLTHVAFYN